MDVTSENFTEEVIESDVPVIVDFWASWCGPCQAMKPVFEKVSQDYKGKMKFAKLDTEAYPETAGEYGIRSIPCMVIFNRGKEIDRIVGFRNEKAFKEDIDSILKKL